MAPRPGNFPCHVITLLITLMAAGCADGGVERPGTRSLVRPFPEATAGRLVEYGYDPGSRVFRMMYEEDPANVAAGAPTVIALPSRRLYPSGMAVTSSDPAGAWQYALDQSGLRLQVWSDSSQPRHLLEIRPR